MLHCALFVLQAFIQCRHNSIIYIVSKKHKFHSTYPSRCHCHEPGHFATFSPYSTSTPFSHTRLHLTDGLVWIKGSPCPDALRYLYAYRIWTVCVLVSDGGETGVHVYLFIIIQRPYISNLNGAHCGEVGWGLAFQVEISQVESNTNECQACHLGKKATVCTADNFTTFICRLSRISGSFRLLEQ
jgi:hypothetical protein